MYERLSIVDHVGIHSIVFGSIFHVGDSVRLRPRSFALAEQFVNPIFNEAEEEEYSQYPIYEQPIPRPSITENVEMNIHNKKPIIHVGKINILGMSAASIFQIGSNLSIDTEDRTKHIRHLHRQIEK